MPNPHFEILQTSVGALEPKLLFEKLPIVLTEGIVNPLDLINKAFKYLYVHKKIHLNAPPQSPESTGWRTNKARFALLISRDDGIIVDIAHPKNHTADQQPTHGVQISLRAHKCMIVPTWWSYRVSDPMQTSIYELFDISSMITHVLF